MIKITQQTTQQEIIQNLLASLSNQGNLFVEVISLPYFLSSLPSIKVFQYKIQNYPRPIYWFSNSQSVLDILSKSQLSLGFPPSLEHSVSSFNNSNKLRSPTIINLKNPENSSQNNNQINQIKNSVEHKSNRSNNLNQRLDQQYLSERESFGVSSFTKPIDFNSSSILDQFREKHLKSKPNQTNIKQDLDQWLQKIESTKNALTKFQNEAEEQKTFAKKNRSWSITKNPNLYKTAVVVSLIACTFGFLWWYPTNNYKLDVVPAIKQESVDAKLPESIFNKTKIELKSSAQVESSGQKTISTSTIRSIGKVSLVNNSSGVVDFNREGLILISESNGLEYSHKANLKNPMVYSIPAKNGLNSQKIEIQIQAVDTGDKFNLPVNSNFKVYNLKGEAMGSSFKAVATTDIKNTEESSEKVFSEDDMSLLRTKVEQGFLEERGKQIQQLKDSDMVTNSSWIKNSQTNYKYSANLGDLTKLVNVEATTTIEILSLPKVALANVIKDKIVNKSISDITIADTTMDDSNVNTKLFVSFVENAEAIKYDITNKFNNTKDFDKTTADVQLLYPNIKKVSKDFYGVNIPLVPQRNKIEINEIK